MTQSIEKEHRHNSHPFYTESKAHVNQVLHPSTQTTNPIWLTNTNKEWESFIVHGQQFNFKTRDYIPQFINGVQGIYFLKHGKAKVVSIDNTGKETPLYYYGPNTLLYEFTPASTLVGCQVYTITPVEAYFFPLSMIMSESFVQEHPNLLLNIIKGQSEKNAYYLRRISAIIEGKAFANVCKLFVDLSRSSNNASDLALGITQEELAALLCVKRCWLGKILRRLKDENIIFRCTKSRLIISDMAKLEEYAFS